MQSSRLVPALAMMLVGCTALRAGSADQPRLRVLYTEDQEDRRTIPDTEQMRLDQRDASRLAEVNRLLEIGAVRTAADHYHAAMVFQHGDDSTSFRRAHELASAAERLGDPRARWLAAASLDRYLLSVGRPQHYGTQFWEGENRLYLQEMDTLAVADAERHRAGARTMAETRAYLLARNGTLEGWFDRPPGRDTTKRVGELIGGMAALSRQIRYPEAARAARIEGGVLLQLIILPDGTVGEAVVIRGLGAGLDEEALRVVRLARFANPSGEEAQIRLTVPFRLSGSAPEPARP